MEIEPLLDRLELIQKFTPEARTALADLFTEQRLNRLDYLAREGSRVSKCYVLLEGVVRVFFSKDGQEYNKTFFTENTFPTTLTALLSGNPCELNFQAITDCSLAVFSYDKFRGLFARHRCLESFMLRVMEQEWVKKERHDIQMVVNDATANYMIFREMHPGLEQLIPQYHIASYLGITPVQLSRIRAQLAASS